MVKLELSDKQYEQLHECVVIAHNSLESMIHSEKSRTDIKDALRKEQHDVIELLDLMADQVETQREEKD